MNEGVLEVRGLSKQFGKKLVLDSVDLSVRPGEVLGLLGKNGCGKTTLMKCALGLLRPSSGEARVLGERAWDLTAEAKACLGYVPQEVAGYPWMRVRQAISYTAAFYPTWNDGLVDDLVRRWSLPLEERVGTLSVGQLQSLGIVTALGHEPSLLVLDEPVASLDPSARREFLRTLLEMVDDPNRTVLFSTHITSDLERVASRVAILRHGKVMYCGGLDDLKDSVKRLRVTFAGAPPASFAVPGALACSIQGQTASVAVADYCPELLYELRERWGADVTVTDLNLEEIFVEMHEEHERPLAAAH